MRRSFYTILRRAIVVALLFGSYNSLAQNITGIWRGYFISEGLDQYKFELQIKQTGSTVSGVSYSYLSTVFYGKATLTGNFNKTAQSALIREIKTVELKMSGGSQACIMKCMFTYQKSGKEEFLEGTFTSVFEKNGLLNKRGQDCGGGKVYLRKVTTSDFYIEPFLTGKVKERPIIINQPPIKKDTAKAKTTVNKPPVKSPPVVKKPVTNPTTKPVTKTPVAKPNNKPVVKIPADTATTSKPVVKTSPPITTPPKLKNRTNELVKTITVNNPEVVVKLYDNGEIDGDTISVYLDKKLVLSAKRLTAAPLIVKFRLEEDDSDHELVMVAENLGRIPPNTSLMIVESGEQRFDTRITSTAQKNAVVRFRYQKPK